MTPTNTVPDAPTNVTATADKDGSITVTWAKATGEGKQVTGYTVTATPTSGTALAPVTATGTSTTFSAAQGIALGTSYMFTVTATNGAGGSSKPSSPSKAVTAATSPSAVTSLAALSGRGAVQALMDMRQRMCGRQPVDQVRREPHTSDRRRRGRCPGSESDRASTQTTVTGLAEQTSYKVSVAAYNRPGAPAR